MARHAYNLLNETKLFLEMKNTTVVEFDDEEWKCDFAFLVDIIQDSQKCEQFQAL
jgi:hypothetical protein